MQTFELFHTGNDSKDDSPTSMELLPVLSSDIMESESWYYKLISFKAADGDLNYYDKLYKFTDWAETYELYVIRSAVAHG